MTIQKSKHNILARSTGDGRWFIANPLYGTADQLTEDELKSYLEDEELGELMERGYLVDPDREMEVFQSKYMDFLDERDDDEVQLFYVPEYGCNFACDYCYQSEYAPEEGLASREVIDAFFKYVDDRFGDKKKYVTLFGGEPLLPSNKARGTVSHFLELAKARDMDTAVVTNGFALDKYGDILKGAKIREIQITLDGMEETHDKRRPLRGGGGTFHKVVEGVDLVLSMGIPVNLRMVVDSANMSELPVLARFAIDKGWTKDPNFKTQLGRNYELHTCQARADSLYSRIIMQRELAEMVSLHPHILEFHKPSFHIVKSLATQGEMPAPIYDSCPGCKTEWAFDHTGKIYSCTATVGKSGEELGTFFPEVSLDEEAIEHWRDRDILAIEKCGDCPVALVCGGGCGSVAKNASGELHSPDCRPVQETVEMGIPVYFDENGEPKG